MPSSEAPTRKLMHLRDIALRGYERDDGLFDIEATLSDTKTYPIETEDRGQIAPGERLHGMTMRMTVDDDFLIHACEAVTEQGPYAICPAAAANFSRIAGLTIGRGFLRAAISRVAGVEGCTHLRELLQPMATVAFQTIGAIRARRRQAREGGPAYAGPSGLIDTCLAYAADGEVARRRWPELAAKR
jgi:hypothetical protein